MTTTELTEIKIFSVEELREAKMQEFEALAKEYEWLAWASFQIVDMKTYDAVKAWQIALRDKRIAIEESRLEFTRVLDQQKKEAIGIEKALVDKILPLEEALKDKRKAFDDEKERIKKEEEAKKALRLAERVKELELYWVKYDPTFIKDMSEEWFRAFADEYKVAYDQEQERIKKEQEEAERKRKEDEEALRKQKEDQDRIAKEQEEKAKELERRQKEIDDKEREQKHQEDIKKAQEQARIDEQNKIERERIAKEEQDKAEKERLEKIEKYKSWLRWWGCEDPSSGDFKTERVWTKVILWKKVDSFEIEQ